MNFKNLFFSILMICFLNNISAQSNNIFQTKGWSFSYFRLSAFEIGEGIATTATQYSGYGLQYNYRFRYNLKDVNDDNSVSVEAIPAIGIDYGEYANSSVGGIMGFHIPLYAAFNTGAGSTYDTSKNFGFGLGLGLDVNYNPIFLIDDEGLADGADLKRLYVDPSIQLNFRYWKTTTSTLREFYIRYNFSSNDSDLDSDPDINRPIHIVLGWMTYLNY